MPDKSVSNKSTPNKFKPNQPVADKVPSKKAIPDKSTASNPTPNKPLRGKARGKTFVPQKAFVNKAVPVRAVPSQAITSEAIQSKQPTPKQPKVFQEPLTPRGLERRLKRHLLKETQEYFAVCAVGFEDVLEQELLGIGVQDSGSGQNTKPLLYKESGGITFTAPLETLYHANLQLRTAHRILLRVDEFLAQSYPMLFNKVEKVPWELYLGFGKTYSIQVSAKESRLHQHKNIAKTIRDGISEYMQTLGLSPQLKDDALIEIHARFFQDRCTLSVNTSGEHLHKRGYRQLVSEAPIRETLAANILQTVDVQNFETIIDPMCGSGTFLIEAALLLKNIAPGLQRVFALEQLPFFQASKRERFKREAVEQQKETSVKLLGFDIDGKNIKIAKANAAKAGVAEFISFEVADAKTLNASPQGKSLIVCNVPYGERLESDILQPFANNLQKNFKGYSFAFVTKEMNWLKPFTLQTNKRFQNGGLNVSLVTGVIQ
jgi:putative N6-adenine-specific DNA methylase